MVHVFIVASKGIPAKYGGFETFVENLTAKKKSSDIYYHVSCMGEPEKHFEYNNADCFNVKVPLPGAPGRIFHVSRALSQVEDWVREHKGTDEVIVYILGCRIGPLLIGHSKKLHKLGAKVYCNPDGLEWKRSKWSAPAKKFLKYCEKCLVTNSDLSICDSVNIEKYIKKSYGVKTTFIAYGADVKESECPETKLNEWYQKFKVEKEKYYLIVGRFVRDNKSCAIVGLPCVIKGSRITMARNKKANTKLFLIYNTSGHANAWLRCPKMLLLRIMGQFSSHVQTWLCRFILHTSTR